MPQSNQTAPFFFMLCNCNMMTNFFDYWQSQTWGYESSLVHSWDPRGAQRLG